MSDNAKRHVIRLFEISNKLFVLLNNPYNRPLNSCGAMSQSRPISRQCHSPDQSPGQCPVQSSLQTMLQSRPVSRQYRSPDQSLGNVAAPTSLQAMSQSWPVSGQCCSPDQSQGNVAAPTTLQAMQCPALGSSRWISSHSLTALLDLGSARFGSGSWKQFHLNQSQFVGHLTQEKDRVHRSRAVTPAFGLDGRSGSSRK